MFPSSLVHIIHTRWTPESEIVWMCVVDGYVPATKRFSLGATQTKKTWKHFKWGKKHLSKGETKRVKDSVVLKAVLKVLYFILRLIFIFRWSRTKTFRSQAKIYFHVHAMAAVRRLLLLISANNRPTTLFRFESSRVTAMGKMVDNWPKRLDWH